MLLVQCLPRPACCTPRHLAIICATHLHVSPGVAWHCLAYSLATASICPCRVCDFVMRQCQRSKVCVSKEHNNRHQPDNLSILLIPPSTLSSTLQLRTKASTLGFQTCLSPPPLRTSALMLESSTLASRRATAAGARPLLLLQK
jgi:hypothetical protein